MKRIFISLLTVLVVLTALLTPPAMAAADIAHGKALFSANCAACHAGGKNAVNPTKTLSLSDLDKYGKHSLEAITTQVSKGQGPMPAFTGRLKPADIEDVASYVLSQAENGW